jgi:Spy/CpxP family protein refolding chaperone
MNRKVIVGSLVGVALLAAVPLLVVAGERGGCPIGAGRHGMFGRHGGFAKMHGVADQLDLSRDQKEALHQIFDRTREQSVSSKQALHESFVDAGQVLLADPGNLAGARAVLDQNDAAVEQLKTTMLASVSEGLKVLTPEQRQKLSVLLASHRSVE